MLWDVPHQRACAFTLQVLHYSSAFKIMSCLYDRPASYPVEIARALSPQDPDVTATRHCLSVLRRTGLVKRADTLAEPGVHSVYTLTSVGTGMIDSLMPLADWSMGRYSITDRMMAAQTAVRLFERRWSFTLLIAVTNAGPAGIEPSRAESAVNELMAQQPERVVHRLHAGSRYVALNGLYDAGLIQKRSASVPGRPTRKLYMASATGLSLLTALWPIAEWGIPHDGQLSAFVGHATTWWAGADGR